jgi:Flp pilus assembly CpaF family ATPase
MLKDENGFTRASNELPAQQHSFVVEIENFLSALAKYSSFLEERCAAMERQLRSAHGVHHELPASAEHTPVKKGDLAPLTPLLEDASVDDIMINGPDTIYFERAGTIEPSEIRFSSHEALEHFTENLMASMGLRMQPDRPFIDARLPDGSRVNIVLPPLSVDGISISIRKIGHTIH